MSCSNWPAVTICGLLSDEVYDEIWFEEPPVSMTTMDDEGRVVTFFSFSKTYAMTGWRVGYMVASPEVTAYVIKAQEPITSCVNNPAQLAAIAALEGPQEIVAEMRDAYHERRDLVTEILVGADIPHVRPQGAFYLLADISRSGVSDLEFAERLVTERQVAVAPGSAFGPNSNAYVRLSFAADPDLLVEGVRRLASAVDDWVADPQKSNNDIAVSPEWRLVRSGRGTGDGGRPPPVSRRGPD